MEKIMILGIACMMGMMMMVGGPRPDLEKRHPLPAVTPGEIDKPNTPFCKAYTGQMSPDKPLYPHAHPINAQKSPR